MNGNFSKIQMFPILLAFIFVIKMLKNSINCDPNNSTVKIIYEHGVYASFLGNRFLEKIALLLTA